MYRRARPRSTARARWPGRRKARRLERRERAVWRRAARLRGHDRRDPRRLRRRARPARRRHARDPERLRRARGPPLPRPGHARAPPRVLYAGQLYPWKGVDVLVEAMAQVPEARLVILGGLDGEPDTRARPGRWCARAAWPTGRRCRARCRRTAWPRELERAAAVVVPFLKTAMTERHTSPLKAFEAMAAGPPHRRLGPAQQPRVPAPRGERAAGAARDRRPSWPRRLRRLLEDPELARRLAQRRLRRRPRVLVGRARAQDQGPVRGGAVSSCARGAACWSSSSCSRCRSSPRGSAARTRSSTSPTCRSAVFDRDLDFEDEYRWFHARDPEGLAGVQGHVPRPARAGHGPPHQLRAPRLRAPVVALLPAGPRLVLAARAARRGACRPTGSRWPYVAAACYASALYGFLGLLLRPRRRSSASAAWPDAAATLRGGRALAGHAGRSTT